MKFSEAKIKPCVYNLQQKCEHKKYDAFRQPVARRCKCKHGCIIIEICDF